MSHEPKDTTLVKGKLIMTKLYSNFVLTSGNVVYRYVVSLILDISEAIYSPEMNTSCPKPQSYNLRERTKL